MAPRILSCSRNSFPSLFYLFPRPLRLLWGRIDMLCISCLFLTYMLPRTPRAVLPNTCGARRKNVRNLRPQLGLVKCSHQKKVGLVTRGTERDAKASQNLQQRVGRGRDAAKSTHNHTLREIVRIGVHVSNLLGDGLNDVISAMVDAFGLKPVLPCSSGPTFGERERGRNPRHEENHEK